MENQALDAPPQRQVLDGRPFEGPVYVSREGFLPESPGLPWACFVQLQPSANTQEITATDASEWLEGRLKQHGAVLLRGFPIQEPEDFEGVLRFLSANLHEDLGGTTRRSPVHGLVFQSSRLEPRHVLDLHNEGTYKTVPPHRLFFCCCRAAPDGGETPIGDSHKVFDRMDPQIREEFVRRGVMYVRHLDSKTSRLIQSWQDSFGTHDRSAVEALCKKRGMDFEWYGEDGLKITEVRKAAAIHPVTQRWSWINQLHLTHRCRWIRTGVLADGMEDSAYPTGSYYGDGGSIPDEIVGHIRRCWLKEEKIFFWQEGDVLVLDNLWVAHGRKPYYGDRNLVVAISDG